MSNIQKKLKELSKGRVSNWSERVANRKENKKWLKYASNIALRILAVIKDNPELAQNKIAKQLDVSPQYINRIIKGKEENLTLKTIAKISDVLGVELITFPPYKYSSIRPEVLSHSGLVRVGKSDVVMASGFVPFTLEEYLNESQHSNIKHAKVIVNSKTYTDSANCFG